MTSQYECKFDLFRANPTCRGCLPFVKNGAHMVVADEHPNSPLLHRYKIMLH
uniref:DUF1289 domain-containing protein n=1 Tax=Ascaris lumbricoides TaxID=6252 RepID=A0A0M3IG95_ASCLU